MDFLSDQEITERLKSPDNLVNKISPPEEESEEDKEIPQSNLEIHTLKRGRTTGKEETPIELRMLATSLALNGETQKNAAKLIGLPQSSVPHFVRGQTSKGNPSEELKEVVARVKKKKKDAEEVAIDLLLDSMTELNGMIPNVKKATDISKIARDLSSIAKDMSGNSDSHTDNSKQVHLHLYAPQQSTLDDYDVIDV